MSTRPCGTCIDDKGRRIGWRVRTERIIQNTKDGYTDLEQPILEVLGYPVAWLPWIRLPDMTDPRKSGFRMPSYDYSRRHRAQGQRALLLRHQPRHGRAVDTLADQHSRAC